MCNLGSREADDADIVATVLGAAPAGAEVRVPERDEWLRERRRRHPIFHQRMYQRVACSLFLFVLRLPSVK